MENTDTPTEVNNAPESQAPVVTESSPVEAKELEVVYDGEPVGKDGETVEVEEETKPDTQSADADTAETESEDTPPEGLTQKSQNRFQQLANENRQLKEQIEAMVQSREQFDIERAIDDGMDPVEARLLSVEDKLAADQQMRQLYELNTTLNAEATNTYRDFPYMDPANESRTEAEKAQAAFLTEQWMKAAHVEVAQAEDGSTFVTNADQSLYDFVKQFDQILSTSRKAAEVDGQRKAEKQLSAVEIPVSPSPKVDTRDDSKLSADAYAKKYGLKVEY